MRIPNNPTRTVGGRASLKRVPKSKTSELRSTCATGRPRGFTLVELLVVIAIMSVLASIGLPLAELSHRRAQEEE